MHSSGAHLPKQSAARAYEGKALRAHLFTQTSRPGWLIVTALIAAGALCCTLQVIEAGLENTASSGGSLSRIASLAKLASKGATAKDGNPGGDTAAPGLSAAGAPGERNQMGMNTFVRRMKEDYDVK